MMTLLKSSFKSKFIYIKKIKALYFSKKSGLLEKMADFHIGAKYLIKEFFFT